MTFTAAAYQVRLTSLVSLSSEYSLTPYHGVKKDRDHTVDDILTIAHPYHTKYSMEHMVG